MASDGVIFFELKDSYGRRVASFGDVDSFPVDFKTRSHENFSLEGKRNAYRKKEQGSIQVIVDESHRDFQGSKAIERTCLIYLTLAPKLQQLARSERQYSETILKRFAHNLINLQARSKDNFNRLMSDAVRGRPYGQLHEEIRRRIEDDINGAANDIVQMAYRSVDLDAQIETLRIISGLADTSAPERALNTNLQRAMYRLTNPFVAEMKKKSVAFEMEIPAPSTDAQKVMIKHGAFNAGIWQLLDNASKYVMPNTNIVIGANLTPGEQQLTFHMTSVCIEPDEVESIFQERYKGRNAGEKAGFGIGMFIVRKALGLMDAKISVTNDGFVAEQEGYNYCNHTFTITFPDK